MSDSLQFNRQDMCFFVRKKNKIMFFFKKLRLSNPNTKTMKAIWNGVEIAESDHTIVMEGNHYFPKESLKDEFFKKSASHTRCPWKGKASYYSVQIDGEINRDAAWYYPNPKSAAKEIKDHVAFWKGVTITS